MIDYVLLVAPLEKEGYSDIQISSILSSVTARDIPAAQLENFLGDQGLANRNPVTGSWQGAADRLDGTRWRTRGRSGGSVQPLK